MGIQTMGSQGDSDSNGKQSQFQQLTQQNSMYSLTLDEVQNQLGDLGKPLSSMNLDELLKNLWTAEANQAFGMETEGTELTNQTALQHQASLSLTSALSKKTVDEVWRDIQQSKNDGEKKSRERQPTLGEMTLEDFLVKAGVVAEASMDKKGGVYVAGLDLSAAPQLAQQGQWMQYPQPQYQHPQQSMVGVYMPTQPLPQPLAIGATAVMDVSYPENQVPLPSPLMGTLSDSQASGRKRGAPEDMIEKNVERRQKRMIKNRESAARSRARKQAYTNELENKVSCLEEENKRLRKRKELEQMLPCTPPPEPKYQLRRTTSAPF
ncbi:ABSCISIC ACID-INSENSITIVE 5-like protein 2 [Durio zibethinus]|uniref:ABSCISIC ACID-INSENSITIVE 5-like protein 2 n=1 Tax=Durio zibethinus TaxID=66656 RepID=A0A6P6ALG3_DURZI|nr:ABSCISIC ACID-INSENSITIVE 5-like protein 2 [Durio zibethinus]XP_022765665.1 ABSCISIC ACID-INSENSITIVE 5-like protein 2 [Durio zibethinus]XP_022765666.1 ABSCISIC ACID-INSENSITIVE 5-like protein 2 [Durio zibethinus]